MADENANRLREHPAERFAAPQHPFDLEAVAVGLAKELHSGQAGHRQQSLYKHGPVSISLFLFGHLTRLAPHRTKGVVSIQVLKGYLRITAEGQVHDLGAGHLLVLASGVEHDVVAREESQMLLTVQLDGEGAKAGK